MTNEKAMSGGGAATSAGTTFQEDVACYLTTLILAESAAEPPCGLPQGVCLSAIVAETSQPIDDLLVGTSAGDVLYVQAKTTLSLSEVPDSEFGKVINQFVLQRLSGARPIGGITRPLDARRDRFILAVGYGAPSTITESLASALTKCRPISDEGRLSEIVDSLNADENRALAAARRHIQTSWTARCGEVPTAQDELSVLHLMYVLQLDLRVDGAAFLRAKDLLRQVVLRDAGRAGDTWSAMISICRSFGPQRTGGDLAYLRGELIRRDVPIRSVPSYAVDIDALQKYTVDRLEYLNRLSFIELKGQRIKICRDVLGALLEFSVDDHTAVVGEPGAGKSGCVHELADKLRVRKADVVLLAADMVEASSPEALATDLGLSKSRGLVDVLQNWSGDGAGYLLVDALDAARSGMSLHVLCQILRDVRERAPRWRIVASIREYDLRTSPDVQDLFAGTPHPKFSDPRFAQVRHVRIDRLSPAELSQVTADHAPIASALATAPALEELVRNPFNLNLLCKLLDFQVSNAELGAVLTQLGLLDLYWSRRVEAGGRIERLLALEAAVEQMVSDRVLHVPRGSLGNASAANSATVDALLSDGVLVELAPRPRAAGVIGFAHNILFDFAVCRLWLDGLSDAAVQRLSEVSNQELLLAIRPSISMAFEELWFADGSRAAFWDRAIAFEQAPEMRLIGKIIAAGIAAQQYRRVADALPLIDMLRRQDASAAALFRYTVQAAVTQQETPDQRLLVGEGAPDWMSLAAELSADLDRVAWEVRSLIWPVLRERSKATDRQASEANTAALALLRFGLGDPRYRNVVRPALEVAATTIASDPETTMSALKEVLTEENLAIGAHEWLHPIAERLHLIARARPEFALRIVDVVFAASGDRDAAVPMGGRILPLTMNKHDLVRMARYQVQQVYGQIWDQDPVTATRIALRVMSATLNEEHKELTEPKNVYRIRFRGGVATLKPDASHIWTAGEHNHHDEWYRILTTFKAGIKNLAKQKDSESRLAAVLDVLRDEADLAVIWSAILDAAAEEPTTLGKAISELLAAPELLGQIDTRKAAGDLITSSFEYLPAERRSAIEAAIARIPEVTSEELREYAESRRDRMLGCIPAHLIQSPELGKLRADLDAAGGAPPNELDFTISTSWEEDDDWWLRRQGVKPEKPENALLLRLSKALNAIRGRAASEEFPSESAKQHLALLEEAETAAVAGHDGGADPPLVQQVEDEIANACARLADTDGLQRDMPLVMFIRTTLRRASTADRPEYQERDNEQWDRDNAGWGSPSPRIDAAMGLMRLAGNPDTVDDEILADVTRLAGDPVPAVRFQVLAHCLCLYRTAPSLMWTLVEKVCAGELRTAILMHFCANVVLRLPPSDHDRLEPLVRALYQRCRRDENIGSARRLCATFYTRAALWRRDDRATRYVQVFAYSPHNFPLESNTVIDNCRRLIRYSKAEAPEENRRVREWAFRYLTQVIKAVLARASELREKHSNGRLDQWPKGDIEELRQLHLLAHNVATEVYFGSGAFEARRSSRADAEEDSPPSDAEKAQLLIEGSELFDALCDVEFVESAYDVLQTLEFLIGADHSGIVLRVAALVRRAERDGIQYESMAADLVVSIVERYLADYGRLFRESGEARAALLDILDVFVGAGWPGATRLTYRLGEVFR